MSIHEMAFSTKEHFAIAVCDGDVKSDIEEITITLVREILEQYINQYSKT